MQRKKSFRVESFLSLKQKFLVFFLCLFIFFFSNSELSPIGLECPNIVFLFFLQFEAKKNHFFFVFFSWLPYIEARNFIFLFDFFFFSTQLKLLTEFRHQELFFSFCSIRFPGPGHKANLFLFLGAPVGAP